MSAGRTLVVVAQSARALAAAAVRAGFRPIAIDGFGDADTDALSADTAVVDGCLDGGFSRDRLAAALDGVLARSAARGDGEPVGVVAGSGFEDRPELLDELAARLPLLGCPAGAVAAVKDPHAFASACRRLGIPHPDPLHLVPAGGRFLVKRIGSTGGLHVRPAIAGPVPVGHIAQPYQPGRSVSAAVLCAGSATRLLGFTRQWTAPTAEVPYRFAGVVGPVDLPAGVASGLERAAAGLAAHFGLVGLVSLDALVDGDAWWLLEVNPRPGGSLDVLDVTDPPLLACHIAACAGRLPEPRRTDATIRATLVVHADTDIPVPEKVDWPVWAMDRPRAGPIPAGAPMATVAAEAGDAVTARRLTEARADMLKKRIRGETIDG